MIAVYLFCMLMFVIFAGFLVAVLGIAEDAYDKRKNFVKTDYAEIKELLKERF
jgi:F0F1-type ATP synthase membrane subunit b/b'